MFPITELFDKYGFEDGANKAVAYDAITLLVEQGIITWSQVVDSCSHNVYIDRKKISKKTEQEIYDFFSEKKEGRGRRA
jgi:hypothetical protein